MTYRIGDDEFLGRATMATSVVAEQGEINNMWAELEDVPNGRILMSLSWLATTKDKSVLQGEKKRVLKYYSPTVTHGKTFVLDFCVLQLTV